MQIGDAEFHRSLLWSVTFPDSVGFIGEDSFLLCSLRRILFSPSIHLAEISDKNFEDCDKLNSSRLPDSVRTIRVCAFGRGSSLTSMHIESTSELPSTEYDTFYENDLRFFGIRLGRIIEEIESETATVAFYRTSISGIPEVGHSESGEDVGKDSLILRLLGDVELVSLIEASAAGSKLIWQSDPNSQGI
jgi:hypothetical protein